MNAVSKKKKQPEADRMRNDYDFSEGVRGKYARRVEQGSNIVVLDDDVAEAFPDSASVNAALREATKKQPER